MEEAARRFISVLWIFGKRSKVVTDSESSAIFDAWLYHIWGIDVTKQWIGSEGSSPGGVGLVTTPWQA